jgi:hypothetical protein
MENQEQPTIQPQMPVQSAPQPTQPPVESKKSFPKWPLIIAAVILIATLLLAGVYFLSQKSNNKVACTTEAKLCPDGSSVGRTGPKCEFSACPKAPTPTPASNPTATWKTFTSTTGKFSFIYPSAWNVATGGSLETGTETSSFGPNVTSASEDVNSKLGIDMQHPSQSTGIIDAKTYLDASSPLKGLTPSNYIIDGIKAYRLVYSDTGSRFDTLFLDKNNIIYVISFGQHGVPSISASDQDLFNQILSTFKFTP